MSTVGDDDETAASQMMLYLDEHAETLGSKMYVDLANFAGKLAKGERLASRMKRKLVHCHGSQCSALVPSNDSVVYSGDDEEDDDEEDDDDGAQSCSSSKLCHGRCFHGSCCSTRSDEIDYTQIDADPSAASAASAAASAASLDAPSSAPSSAPLDAPLDAPSSAPLSKAPKLSKRSTPLSKQSGFFIQSMNNYYRIPETAIKYMYNHPIEMETTRQFYSVSEAGKRGMSWESFIDKGRLNDKSVVVLTMKNRNNELDYAWCVILKLTQPPSQKVIDFVGSVDGANGDDDKIMYMLPEAAVWKLVMTMRESTTESVLNCSLLSRFLPSFMKLQTYSVCRPVHYYPIPGMSRRRKKKRSLSDVDGADTVVFEHGNGWKTQSYRKRRVLSSVELITAASIDWGFEN